MRDFARRPQLGPSLLAVAVAAILGCSAPTDSAALRTDVEQLPEPQLAPPSVQVVGPGAFAVTASIVYPCTPYTLRSSGRREGALLIVRAEGRQKDGCPQDVTGVMSYRIDVRDVPAGLYQLRVINEHREWVTTPDTVLALSVDVR